MRFFSISLKNLLILSIGILKIFVNLLGYKYILIVLIYISQITNSWALFHYFHMPTGDTDFHFCELLDLYTYLVHIFYQVVCLLLIYRINNLWFCVLQVSFRSMRAFKLCIWCTFHFLLGNGSVFFTLMSNVFTYFPMVCGFLVF